MRFTHEQEFQLLEVWHQLVCMLLEFIIFCDQWDCKCWFGGYNLHSKDGTHFLTSRHLAVTTSNDKRRTWSFSPWPQEAFSGWKTTTVASHSAVPFFPLPSPYAHHSPSTLLIGLPFWFFATTWSLAASHCFLLPCRFFSLLPPTCTKATWRVCF